MGVQGSANSRAAPQLHGSSTQVDFQRQGFSSTPTLGQEEPASGMGCSLAVAHDDVWPAWEDTAPI